jgi:hypothetical protein
MVPVRLARERNTVEALYVHLDWGVAFAIAAEL